MGGYFPAVAPPSPSVGSTISARTARAAHPAPYAPPSTHVGAAGEGLTPRKLLHPPSVKTVVAPTPSPASRDRPDLASLLLHPLHDKCQVRRNSPLVRAATRAGGSRRAARR